MAMTFRRREPAQLPYYRSAVETTRRWADILGVEPIDACALLFSETGVGERCYCGCGLPLTHRVDFLVHDHIDAVNLDPYPVTPTENAWRAWARIHVLGETNRVGETGQPSCVAARTCREGVPCWPTVTPAAPSEGVA